MATPPFVIKRPTQLPRKTDPVPSDVTVSDDGSSLSGVTWEDGVNAAIPVASQSEAADGTDNHKRMTPLTTRQAIDEQVPPKISMAIAGLNLGSAAQAQVQDFATAEQGTKADTAVQPDDLASVATSGSYNDLSDKPILGTAASTDASDYATAEQGDKADSAVQPDDLALVATSGSYGDLSNKPTLGTAAATDASDYATAVQAVPAGGEAGQVLQKNSLIDNDVKWGTIFSPPPANLQNSRMDAQLSDIPPDVEFVSTAGFSAPGDGGGALYKRVSSEPSHAGKFQSADGAWWEITSPEVSHAQVQGTLAQLIDAAWGKTAVLEEGTLTLNALTNISTVQNIRIKGRNALTSVLKRGASPTSLISFNAAHGVSMEDLTINMDFARTSNQGHGIIFVDTDDATAKNVRILGLGNTGGTAGSGIISYSSGSFVPKRNKILDSSVIADVTLSDNTNGFLLTDTRYSQMRGNYAEGIAAFAHEYKNDARYNTGSDLIANYSGYGLGFGQTTEGVDGVDYTAITNVVANACDVGFVLGEGAYNSINNLIVNTNGSPGKLSGKYGVRISGGATGNLISDVVSVGSGTAASVRIDDSIRNHVSIAIHDGSSQSIVFSGTSSANFIEVLHTGVHVSVDNKINDSTGNFINAGNANIVYSPTTGERLGSRSGYFKDSLVRGQAISYASNQRWRFESSDSVILTGGLPATGGDSFGLQLNVGSTVRLAGFFYSVPLDRWTMYVDGATIGRFDKQVWSPVSDNTIALGSGAARFSTVYASSGTINTSDAREKDWRGGLNESEINVARRLSKLVGIYRWKDMIAKKGDGARLHAGVKAQDVIAAFEYEGLDPFRYGVVCYDEWQEVPEVKSPVLDESGNETDEFEITQEYEAAGNRYGVRYEELWAFVAAGFEARLAALES